MTNERFPDGALIDTWFYELSVPDPQAMGKIYSITDFGAADDGVVHTAEIQSAIDAAAGNGGGVVAVPAGTYISGALQLKDGVGLWVKAGGILMGSDDIADYPPEQTRIEGQSCLYFPALINVKNAEHVHIWGPGTIDGNGLRSWKAFWIRRKWNPACTNKDEQRARLIYMENCHDVTVSGITLQNSQFWTNHIYKCDHVRYLSCRITSPRAPVPAPSTDALDIDACHDVLVKNCYMAVNDDAVVLKGGKGPWADMAPENGENERILVEDCGFGFCHGCLTCGSESIHIRNIILRRITASEGLNLLWLKMRTDTPQLYEYITAEDIKGKIDSFVNVNPWTQFADLQGREDMPVSRSEHITIRRCECECKKAFNVLLKEVQYHLSGFTLQDLSVNALEAGLDMRQIPDTKVENVVITIRQ